MRPRTLRNRSLTGRSRNASLCRDSIPRKPLPAKRANLLNVNGDARPDSKHFCVQNLADPLRFNTRPGAGHFDL